MHQPKAAVSVWSMDIQRNIYFITNIKCWILSNFYLSFHICNGSCIQWVKKPFLIECKIYKRDVLLRFFFFILPAIIFSTALKPAKHTQQTSICYCAPPPWPYTLFCSSPLHVVPCSCLGCKFSMPGLSSCVFVQNPKQREPDASGHEGSTNNISEDGCSYKFPHPCPVHFASTHPGEFSALLG